MKKRERKGGTEEEKEDAYLYIQRCLLTLTALLQAHGLSMYKRASHTPKVCLMYLYIIGMSKMSPPTDNEYAFHVNLSVYALMPTRLQKYHVPYARNLPCHTHVHMTYPVCHTIH